MFYYDFTKSNLVFGVNFIPNFIWEKAAKMIHFSSLNAHKMANFDLTEFIEPSLKRVHWGLNDEIDIGEVWGSFKIHLKPLLLGKDLGILHIAYFTNSMRILYELIFRRYTISYIS